MQLDDLSSCARFVPASDIFSCIQILIKYTYLTVDVLSDVYIHLIEIML